MSMLKRLREEKNLSQTELAKMAKTSQPQIQRLEIGKRKMTKEWAARFAPIFGISAQELLFSEKQDDDVEIVGMAGADTEGERIYGHGQGALGHVERVPGSTRSTVAVIVRGRSMRPFADDGSIIYYDDMRTPPTDDMLGEVVVVGLDDDRVLLKRLLRGDPDRPGHFDLESFNGERIPDQRVTWAAFIAAVIPPRQARRIMRDSSQV